MNQKKLIGVIGIAGTVVLLAAIVVSIITFENGAFSPANGFYSELGQYPGAYLSPSSALVYDAGMAVFGLLLCIFMVCWGIRQNSWAFGTVSFFGILTGVLAIAQAVFSLDFARYHYIAVAAFSIAIFLFGASYIIASLTTGQNRRVGAVLIAFLSAVCGAIYAGYIITGGMTQVFVEDASQVGRLAFMPFAVIGWLSLLLVMALQVLLSVDVLQDRQTARMANLAEKIRRGNSRDIEF